jgi:hypothetical protein
MKIHSVVIGLTVGVMLSGCIDSGNGNKVGSVTKLAQEGVFCKTWEGQLIRGGFSNGSGVMGAPFEFTIENNPELVKKVAELMDSQQEVKITYRTEAMTLCRSDSYNHFLTDIEVLGKQAEHPMKIDSTEPIKVEPVKSDPVSSHDKMLKLLQTQQQIITELVNEKK